MNKIKIPKKFMLGGKTITIVFDENLLRDSDWVGLADYRQNKIKLQPDTPSSKIPPDSMEHNFFHELMHWVLYMASQQGGNKEYLHKNENLVELCATFLYQALKTAEYK